VCEKGVTAQTATRSNLLTLPTTTMNTPSAETSFRATPDAWNTVTKANMYAAVERHRAHNWDDQGPTIKQRNEEALQSGGRLFSVHVDRNKVKFFVTSSPEFTRPLVTVPKRK